MAEQTALTGPQRQALAADGYLLVPSVLPAGVVAGLAARLEQFARATLDRMEATPDATWEESGVVYDRMDLADPQYAELIGNPLLVSAAETVIGPGCQVTGLSLRAPLPGSGHQGLHPDFYPGQRTSGPWQVLAAMWCISAFTPDNGAMRVIPGSHRRIMDPADDMKWPGMGPHPDEVKLIGPAGSLILFNSASLWHSGTLNYSPEPRLAVTAYLTQGNPAGGPASQ